MSRIIFRESKRFLCVTFIRSANSKSARVKMLLVKNKNIAVSRKIYKIIEYLNIKKDNPFLLK